MKSSRASKIISGILLTPALLILLSLLIILPSTALAQLESFVHSIQDPSTTLHFSWNNLTFKTLYSPWSIMTLLFCIYKVTPAYNLILKQAIYGIKQTWLSFNTSNDSLYNSQETMPCTYHQENLKQQQQSHRQSNRKKQPQLHLVNNVKKEVEEEKEPQQPQKEKEKEEEEKESNVEIKQNITIAATIATTASITKQEDNTDPVEWTVVKEKSSKKKKRTKTKRNNNMQVPTFVNSNGQIKNKTSKPAKGLSSSANTNHVNGVNTVMTPITTTSTTSVTDSTSGNTNPKKIKNKTNNNNIKTTNTDITPITFAATVAAATTSTPTATMTTSSVKPNNNNNNDNNDWQMETNLFQDNDKQETLYSVSNSSEDENQPDVPFLSDNESSGSESPCSTHNSLPPPLQDEPTSNYYSPFSTGFDFGVATSIPTGHIHDDGQEDIWNPTRHHQWESGFLRPLYYTHQNHHHHQQQHKTSLLHLLNQPDKVETTITSESFRYFDDMVMSNTLYSSPPLQKSRVPRDWDSVLSASHHEIK